MNESAPRFIGERITIEKSKEQMVVTIRQQIARWQEALLIAWIVAWTFCGAFFIYYFVLAGDNIGQRIFFGCFMAAWFYFEWRITKAFMWRKKGKEILSDHHAYHATPKHLCRLPLGFTRSARLDIQHDRIFHPRSRACC